MPEVWPAVDRRPSVPGLLSALLIASDDGFIAAMAVVATVLVALMGITVDQVRRGNDKSEKQLKAAGDASVHATNIVDGKVTALTAKVDDARERLSRTEGSLTVLMRGQVGVALQAYETHEAVVEVHQQLATENGQSVGEMADLNEGRRIQAIPVDQRTESEQVYVTRLVDHGRDR